MASLQKIRKAQSYIPFRGDVKRSDGTVKQENFRLKFIQVREEKKPDNKKPKTSNVEPQEDTANYTDSRIISPPYNPNLFVKLEEESNILRECIDTMSVNIGGFGYLYRPRKLRSKNKKTTAKKTDAETTEYEDQVDDERVALENWIPSLSPEMPFVETRKRMRHDLELSGNGYWEIVRDTQDNIIEINHVPFVRMRLTKLDKKATSYKIPYIDHADDYKIKWRKRRKKFRRFVQVDSSGRPKTWFKEFGDKRKIRKEDGKVDKKVGLGNRATEIIHFKLYSPRTPYGIPRWIGRFVSVTGSRRAEEVNFFTLSNNHVPSMFILVENGSLTGGSVARLQEVIDSQVAGNPNYSQIIILESESGENEVFPGQMSGSQAKLTIKQSKDAQRDDSLYQEYDKNNQDKVRQSFRLPPIYVGRADDYTRGTADVSRRIADEQVFAPERETVDHPINVMMLEAGFRWHIFKTRTPNITDNEVLAKAMIAAESSGGMTPRRADTLMEDIFGGDLGPLPNIDLDKPFKLQFAEAQQGMKDQTEAKPEPATEGSERSTINELWGEWADQVYREVG